MKGEVIVITWGDYSDYSVIAVLRWTSEKTPEEVRDEWLALPEQRETIRTGTSKLDRYGFVAWLVLRGYAVDLEAAQELYLGWYNFEFLEWNRHPLSRGNQ